MMEDWLQKLHNNSSPDDMVICIFFPFLYAYPGFLYLDIYTAPPPEASNFPNVGLGHMGGFIPIATARFGNFAFSAGFGGLFPSIFNIQVTVPNGSLSHLSVKVNVGFPPDAVYNIVTDPDNKRVFKNIQVVDLEQAALWKFLWWSGMIPVHVLGDQNMEDHSVRTKFPSVHFLMLKNTIIGSSLLKLLKADKKEQLINLARFIEDVHSGSDLESAIDICSSIPQKLLESCFELRLSIVTFHGRLKDLFFLDLADLALDLAVRTTMVGVCNIGFLSERLPSWIKLPVTIAIPFGVYETIISDDIYKVQVLVFPAFVCFSAHIGIRLICFTGSRSNSELVISMYTGI
ncbi:hypothetical protein POM88_000359 [Heracleum sosnowskyi]|uniref:Uncharacterized protein n=1 Tax=Heracleum sosnowskyi TaxID=360622 RepID=A0AAD8JC58_9APIA|nr:hypothetical protein POM88_000359 [Heracleum sosnowskyi]